MKDQTLVLCEDDILELNADHFSGKIVLKVESVRQGWFIFPPRVKLSVVATPAPPEDPPTPSSVTIVTVRDSDPPT